MIVVSQEMTQAGLAAKPLCLWLIFWYFQLTTRECHGGQQFGLSQGVLCVRKFVCQAHRTDTWFSCRRRGALVPQAGASGMQ